MKAYRSSAKDCGPCPLRSVSIGKSEFTKIDDSVDKPLYDHMHAGMQTMNSERIRRLRSSTVEPVLGTLVSYLAMRRVNTRGIKQASRCILMSAIASNLKKLLKWESGKIKVAATAKMKELKNELQSLCFTFFRSLVYCPSV
jgi:hypothetical protein